MKLNFTIYTVLLISMVRLNAQTVPVTFHLDANNTQFKTVKMWHMPDYFDYTDDDGDRIFELTLDLQPGTFEYSVLQDNAWGFDPHNPTGSIMSVSDPMISYLLPKNSDMLRENRIQANFAYTASNPPLASTISVTINGNSIPNTAQYFDADKRQLLINDPPYLLNGSNTITVAYTTNKGSVSRSSTFKYEPIKLMIDTMVYRMEHILGWGRVFQKPYPASVFIQSNAQVSEADVNAEGYFGSDIQILNGVNQVKVAYTQAELTNPIDEMSVNAEIRHKWWVELTGNINGTNAIIQAVPHSIDQNDLNYVWRQSEDNPDGVSISGSSPNLTFEIPAQEGSYIIELKATTNTGEEYIARKLLTTKGTPHFIAVNERAPWMETMVLYEVETDFFDWNQFNFQNMKKTFQHMKDLGVNVFRITPFNLGGFISTDHFEIYPSNGSISDLKDMIETAHQYGLKVLFDVPLSHTAPFHPFILPNFLLKENAEPYDHFSLWQGNPGESDVVFSLGNGRNCVYTNLDNPYTQEYFTRLMEYWIEVAGCDGFRIDCGQESFLRSPDFIKQLHKRLRNINPNLFILEEGDNRDDPEVNYYDFGDAAYDWVLNTQWSSGTVGLPGLFEGNYSVEQLHALLTTGTPDSGLVMRFANTGYFDYLSRIYGTEQERSAVALVTTTYGLPNIRAGEEVGLARANRMYDISDPLGVMPFYSRLIKARKFFIGNYPKIERLTENIPNQVYAYTSKSNGEIIFTIINFSSAQTTANINLKNPTFENKGQTPWFNIVDNIQVNNSDQDLMTVPLGAWKAKVFAINHLGLDGDSVQITFQVDLQNEIISPNGIYLKGNWDNWASPVRMNNTTSKIYTITLKLAFPKTIEYKYYNGNPDGNWEDVKAETFMGECTDEWTNRIYTVPNHDALVNIDCFNSCGACPVKDSVAVTFRVDMQSESISNDGVHLNGSFCNWNTEEAISMSASGSIYSTTVKLTVGDTIEYKYVNGAANNWGKYEILAGQACAYGSDANRRFVVPTSDTPLNVVCFASCNECQNTSVHNLLQESINIFPNPTNGYFTISGLPEERLQIIIFNTEGNKVLHYNTESAKSLTIDVSGFRTGIYTLMINYLNGVRLVNTKLIKQ